ncbi:MAG: hypothetical protein ACT6UH_22355 [Hydrogenophaga sp.]|uniref:hypothetical protein n=1 Tax=Hydrogenophaga sp. TaxID=1904254 RepID=UPI0040357775
MSKRMLAAFDAGDMKVAREWQSRMYAAIRSRTPAHQAKLTARIEVALAEGMTT